MLNESEFIQQEANNLQTKIQIIKDVITTQQLYAKVGLHVEEVQNQHSETLRNSSGR